jgi:hypothetical protein
VEAREEAKYLRQDISLLFLKLNRAVKKSTYTKQAIPFTLRENSTCCL